VVCSRNVVIKPDTSLADAAAKDYDVIVCPGGLKGSEALAAVGITKLFYEKLIKLFFSVGHLQHFDYKSMLEDYMLGENYKYITIIMNFRTF